LARFKIVSGLLFGLFFMVMTACGELSEYENKQVEEALNDSLLSTTESWDINMEVLEDEMLKMTLKGSYAATINMLNLNITKISGPVYIEMFNEDGQADTFISADSAVHKPLVGQFELFGNVLVKAPGGKRLQTEYLKWDRFKDRVSTPEFLVIVTERDSIAAIGLDGDSDLTNYTLREVTGETVID